MQAKSSIFNIERTQIPMHSGVIEVNYVEMADESCVEFAHTHVDYEIYYCMEGQMQLTAEDKVYYLAPHQYMLISPGVMHEVRYSPENAKKYFIFIFQVAKHAKKPEENEKVFFDAMDELFRQGSVFMGMDRRGAYEVVDKLVAEHTGKLYGFKEMLRGCYLEFLIRILRNLIHQDGTAGVDSKNINMAMHITMYMHESYARNISLQDVADAMFVTPRHINRIFKEYYGSSFHKTLRTYRVSYAKNYLHDTDFSVEKIAELVGFSSSQQLQRLFAEMEGMTISEYRAKFKDRQAARVEEEMFDEGPGNTQRAYSGPVRGGNNESGGTCMAGLDETLDPYVDEVELEENSGIEPNSE